MNHQTSISLSQERRSVTNCKMAEEAAPGTAQARTAQAELEILCGLRADKYLHKRGIALGHFLLLARICHRLMFTRKVRLDLSGDNEGGIIRYWLNRSKFKRLPWLGEAASILEIERRGEPLSGSAFGTLRRMERKAAKLGITCQIVAEHERDQLLAKAVKFEKAHPDTRYRSECPDSADLCKTDLWLVATSRTGEPLVLSVTPISGNVALLRFLRTFAMSSEATLARYAITAELVRKLTERRVRYLIDSASPLSVPSTLRHYATMVGFRIIRRNTTTKV